MTLRLSLPSTVFLFILGTNMAHSESPAFNIPDGVVDGAIERLLPTTRGAEVRKPLRIAGDALAYAESVIRATDGAAALAQQAPYIVEEDADTWLIRGTKSRIPHVLDPVELRLSKTDASVVSYGSGFMGGAKAPLHGGQASD